MSKEGYLTKEGGGFKSWKKRWFVLKGGSLAYYNKRGVCYYFLFLCLSTTKRIILFNDSQWCLRIFIYKQDADPLGVIYLVTAGRIQGTDRKKKAHGFEIPTPARTFYLSADSETERQSWLDCLEPETISVHPTKTQVS